MSKVFADFVPSRTVCFQETIISVSVFVALSHFGVQQPHLSCLGDFLPVHWSVSCLTNMTGFRMLWSTTSWWVHFYFMLFPAYASPRLEHGASPISPEVRASKQRLWTSKLFFLWKVAFKFVTAWKPYVGYNKEQKLGVYFRDKRFELGASARYSNTLLLDHAATAFITRWKSI